MHRAPGRHRSSLVCLDRTPRPPMARPRNYATAPSASVTPNHWRAFLASGRFNARQGGHAPPPLPKAILRQRSSSRPDGGVPVGGLLLRARNGRPIRWGGAVANERRFYTSSHTGIAIGYVVSDCGGKCADWAKKCAVCWRELLRRCGMRKSAEPVERGGKCMIRGSKGTTVSVRC